MAIRERNGKLEVVVYVERVAGRRVSHSRTIQGTGRASRKLAKQVEADLIREASAQRATERNATVGHLLDRWLDAARVERSTGYNDALSLNKHVRPVLGTMPLSRLRPADLDALYRRLERGDRKHPPLAPATVRRIHNRLSAALTQAKKWHWIAVNPAADASPPSIPAREPESPPTEAVLAYLALLAEKPELRTFVWLCAATGLRRSAAAALMRSDLDLELRFDPTLGTEAGELRTRRALGMAAGAPYVKGTKTGAKASLAIGPLTVAMLVGHLQAQDETAALFGGTVGDGYVFSHHDDCSVPWRPDWPTRQLRRLREDHPGLERVTLRSLRNWMITEGIEAGIPIDAVAGRAQHKRVSMTLDTYKSSVPASDQKLALALEGLLAATDG